MASDDITGFSRTGSANPANDTDRLPGSGPQPDPLPRTVILPGGVPTLLASNPKLSPAEMEQLFADPADLIVPGYEILSKLGEGGMGTVYHARQTGLNREVALKLIPRTLGDPSGLARFLTEAESAAAVQHPNVVHVYDFGQFGGRPFLALEYLSGGSLAAILRSVGRLSPEDAALLVEKLARGTQAAHEAGVVHRDLKPENVLFDARGEPKITDFGLAKRTSVNLTASQVVMGSPAYMAPEQARGEGKFVGPAADVWALGVILYECLTGVRPFNGDTPTAMMYQVMIAHPRPPRQLAPWVTRDLDRVCLKCLEKDPHERYASAAELAADLQRFLGGKPVHVRALGPVERSALWARRNPTLAAAYALTAVVIALTAFAGTSAVLWRRSEAARTLAVDATGKANLATKEAEVALAQLDAKKREVDLALAQLTVEQRKTIAEQQLTAHEKANAIAERNKAQAAKLAEEAAKRTAEAAQARAERFNYAWLINMARVEWTVNDQAHARELLAACPPDYRGWEWRYLTRLCNAEATRIGMGPFASAAFDAAGTKLVTAGGDGFARIWDVKTRKEVQKVGGPAEGVLFAASLSPDGKVALTLGRNGVARIWDVVSGKAVATLSVPEITRTARFSKDGTKVVTAAADGYARVFDAAKGYERILAVGNKGQLTAASLSPDGTRLATMTVNGTVRIWDTVTAKAEKELLSFRAHPLATDVVYSPDNRLLATAGFEDTVRLWDADTGEEKASLQAVPVPRNALEFHRDGRRLATAGTDGIVRVWEIGGKEVATIRGQRNGLRSVAFGPDENTLVTVDDDGGARVWNMSAGTGSIEWPMRTPAMAVSADAGLVLTATAGSRAAVLESITGKERAKLKLPDKVTITAAAFSPDGSKVATIGKDGIGRVWDAKTGTEIAVHRAKVGAGTAIAFSPDGKRIVTGGADGAGAVWEAATGNVVASLDGRTGSIRMAAFDPSGKWVVTAGSDGAARIWDAGSGAESKSLSEPGVGVASAVFGKSVDTVFVGGVDGVIRVYDTKSGGPPSRLAGGRPVGPVLAASPDGSRVLSGAANGWVWLWDTTSLADVYSQQVTQVPADLLGFSTDGTKVIAGARSVRAVVWDAAK